MSPTKKFTASDSVDQIATVRIELLHTDPVIWREVEVPTSITLDILHGIVQVAMGWEDDHLWEFMIAKQSYGVGDDWGMGRLMDASEVLLRDVLRPRKTTIDYLYDFGDSWKHRLTVTRIRAGLPETSYPRFVGGERNAPPEDCGGIWGFYNKLEALADPDHPDHEFAEEWLGDYDPDAVDVEAIKARLDRIASAHAAAIGRNSAKNAGKGRAGKAQSARGGDLFLNPDRDAALVGLLVRALAEAATTGGEDAKIAATALPKPDKLQNRSRKRTAGNGKRQPKNR